MAKIALLRHAVAQNRTKTALLRHAEEGIFKKQSYCVTRKPKKWQNSAFCATQKHFLSKVIGFASRSSISFCATKVLRHAEAQNWAKIKVPRDAERLLLENDSFRAAQKGQFFGSIASASRKNRLFGQALFPRRAEEMAGLIEK